MGKYQELVEDVEKARQILNVLKTKISRDFVTQLADVWGCEKKSITVEFEPPKYTKGNNLISWKFDLAITINTPQITITFHLNGFSLMTEKDSKMESSITILYKDKPYILNEPIEDFSDTIFKEIQRKIEDCSWF